MAYHGRAYAHVCIHVWCSSWCQPIILVFVLALGSHFDVLCTPTSLERGGARVEVGWATRVRVRGGGPAGDVAARRSALHGGRSWVGLLTWVLLLFVAFLFRVGHMWALPGCGSPPWSMRLVAFRLAVVFIGRCHRWLLSSLTIVFVGHHLHWLSSLLVVVFVGCHHWLSP